MRPSLVNEFSCCALHYCRGEFAENITKTVVVAVATAAVVSLGTPELEMRDSIRLRFLSLGTPEHLGLGHVYVYVYI